MTHDPKKTADMVLLNGPVVGTAFLAADSASSSKGEALAALCGAAAVAAYTLDVPRDEFLELMSEFYDRVPAAHEELNRLEQSELFRMKAREVA